MTPHPPSPIRVRPYGFVRALRGRGHSITVAAPVSGEREAADAQRLADAGVRVVTQPVNRASQVAFTLAGFVRGDPMQAWVNWDWRLQRRLGRLVEAGPAGAAASTGAGGSEAAPGSGATVEPGEAFDLVHVEHLRGARYGLALRRDLPVVWDAVDSITHLLRQAKTASRSQRGRLLAAVELGRTVPYEAWLAGAFDRAIVTSSIDRQALLDLRSGERSHEMPEVRAAEVRRRRAGTGLSEPPALPPPGIDVVPNIVDLTYWSDVADVADVAGASGASDTVLTGSGVSGHENVARPESMAESILMTGKLSYHANVTAALYLLDEVMPLVWDRRPAAELVLAGAQPAKAVLAAAEAAPGPVRVTGFLEDLRPCFRQARVAVAPVIYGAGIQNKVLEAMATGTPVVVSEAAATPMGIESGREALVAGDAKGFAADILTLLDARETAAAIGATGQRFVADAYGADVVAPRLEAAYEHALERGRQRLESSE